MGAATWITCLALVANAGPVDTFYVNQRDFVIPANIKDARRAEIQEIILFQAASDGQTWNPVARIGPTDKGFTFHAPDDGRYLLKLAVVNRLTGRQEPQDVAHEGDAHGIVVDTAKPILRFQTVDRQGDEMLVRWQVIEANPDWSTLKLEYRSDAAGALWSTAAVAAPQSGQATFRVDGPVAAVRLSLTDLAKNESGWVEQAVRPGGGSTTIAGAGGSGGLPPLASDRGWSPTPPGGAVTTGLTRPVPNSIAGPEAGEVHPAHSPLPPVKMVRKRQVTIDYEVTKFGPSGIKSVEVYVTRDDGRTWQRGFAEENITTPLAPDSRLAPLACKRSLTMELPADGVYGFYLVVKSGAGLGKPPPQNGIDLPQLRVEVDTTFPKAELFNPRPHPTRRDCLILSWTATDNKLGPTPITLQWAERADGEWQSIGGAELPNTGEYVWQVPANIPAHVFLRLLVRDLAGNESVGQSAEPVLVDLSEPEVKPIQISAGAR